MTSEERHEARYQRRATARDEKRRRFIEQYDRFENVCDLNKLYHAEHESAKGVKWKASVQKYEMNLLRNLITTRNDLLNGKDVRKGFIEFDIHERGKARHIRSMHYAERVIQRCLCDNALVPVLTHSIVYDNGASLKGKGIHFAMYRVKHQLQEYFRKHHTNEGWILLMDYSSYFDNILHEPLYELIDRNFKDERLKRLIKSFIDAFGDKGIGIGSQVSQVFAVAYPNRIDHAIREVYGCGLAQRYMDDTLVISESKEKLETIRDYIMQEAAKLGIIISSKKTKIIPLRSFTFLKVRYFLTNTGKVIMKHCRKSFTRMRRKLHAFRRFVDEGVMTVEQVIQSYMSWKGYNAHFDCYKSLQEMDKMFYSTFHVWPKDIKCKRSGCVCGY